MKNNNTTLPFRFFPRVAKAYVLELTKFTFGRVAHAQKTEIMQIYSWKGSACEWKTRKKKFLWSFHEAVSRMDWNQGAICENVSCMTESVAESIDRAPAKPFPAKRRCFQTFKKVHHKKWSFATVDEKGDNCMNSAVHSSVVKWLNWWTVKLDRQTAFSAARNW